MASAAITLKEQGNKAFQAGDFKEAEVLYTRAIQKDPTNPILFTNRAFSRTMLQAWDSCIDDCIKAIELQRDNMKAYFYLAKAQLALHHPNEALTSALTAYDLAIRTHNASASNISTIVLQAKKEKWEMRERERIRRRSELLQELEDSILNNSRNEVRALEEKIEKYGIDQVEGLEEKAEIELATRRKVEELRSIFAIADPEHLQRREVPDYLIDNISFAIMHDPVVTKNGQSYDRSTILEHLRRSETDPLTREPLKPEELRPNLALKQACTEFLEANGWAVDW